MNYKHLSLEERHYIEHSLKNGKSFARIADEFIRSETAISKEVTRNTGKGGYRHKQADSLA